MKTWVNYMRYLLKLLNSGSNRRKRSGRQGGRWGWEGDGEVQEQLVAAAISIDSYKMYLLCWDLETEQFSTCKMLWGSFKIFYFWVTPRQNWEILNFILNVSHMPFSNLPVDWYCTPYMAISWIHVFWTRH